MNKLFTMAHQVGNTIRQHIAMLLHLDAMSKPASTFLPIQHWPMPNQRNSTAAADKRCAQRRRNIAKRRG